MRKKVVIIGAGVSGLACGIYCQKKGFETVIYEKTASVGGNLTGWFRQGCYIDNCLHWLNGSKQGSNLNKIWKEINGINETTQFHQSDSFYVSEYDNKKVEMSKNIEKTHLDMLKVSIEDKKEINKFINAIKTCNMLLERNSFKTNFKKITACLKLFFTYGNSTINEVSESFKSPILKKFLTDYILGEYSIYSLLFAYASFTRGDGMVLKDGSHNMAKRIENCYINNDGKIVFNSEVKKIIMKDGEATGITLQNDTFVPADYVVCCTDAQVIFNNLLDNKLMPKRLRKTYKQRKYYPIISSFHIAYKVDNVENIKIPESFVFESNPIKIGKTMYNRIMLKNYNYGNFCSGDSYVLQVFLLQREMDYDYWATLSNSDYKEEKQRITKEITNAITDRFDELKDKITFLDCWTPLTYTKYFNAYKGSYMSFGITKKIRLKSIGFKVPKTKNVFLATQWQKLFGGLPNAVLQGKNCANEIYKTI